ncbi:hypothetical protein [Streptomyces sp. NPDC096013]|uniref:hypothetical protein n=1 Tax=Streptomyces sp. NPDC096013 TaxID=3366069 RepID=UPI0037FA167C
MTGFVTGTMRVLGEGADAGLVAAPEAPVELGDELGAAAVVDAASADWVVCVRDTVFVPAVGHTGLTARYRPAALNPLGWPAVGLCKA